MASSQKSCFAFLQFAASDKYVFVFFFLSIKYGWCKRVVCNCVYNHRACFCLADRALECVFRRAIMDGNDTSLSPTHIAALPWPANSNPASVCVSGPDAQSSCLRRCLVKFRQRRKRYRRIFPQMSQTFVCICIFCIFGKLFLSLRSPPVCTCSHLYLTVACACLSPS